MLVVGLTGNIGSGKTTAAGMFGRLGAKIIDVDKLGHLLLRSRGIIWRRLKDSFGKEILNSHQAIDRKKLGRIVFGDSKKLKLLNAVIHPALIRKAKEKVLQLKKRRRKSIAIIDAALLIEMFPLLKILDYLIVVKINKPVQIRRLLKSQSELSKGKILQRIKAQLPQEKKIKLADYIIDNSGGRAQTKKQVKKIWEALKAKTKEEKRTTENTEKR